MIVQLSSEERRKIQDLVDLLLNANAQADYNGLKPTPDQEAEIVSLASDINQFLR